MAKNKEKMRYVCQSCGAVYAKWQGKCSTCDAWNSIEQEVVIEATAPSISTNERPILLNQVDSSEEPRINTGISELDVVLGGGVVQGSLTLVGGDPGIGKSTLLLQTAHHLSEQGHKVLYVSGEESIKQTKLRADRLGVASDLLYIVSENNMSQIASHIGTIKPKFLIVDSIQTVYSTEVASTPGSVTQVREAANRFMSMAKKDGISTFLVGHVTKSGNIAGPKVLEHMVDTVLYFEGDGQRMYRMLRAVKNRFGSTNEIGVFEMTASGLIDVENPSKLFLAGASEGQAGSVILAALEGSRTMLVEMQCLVSHSNFSNPRRMAHGIDYNKLVLLIAILEKRAGFELYQHDVYVNVVGGVTVDEPSVDLAIVMAIVSSYQDQSMPHDMVFIGEVGLTGEIRNVSQIQQRINEAARMGFHTAVIPHGNLDELNRPNHFRVIGLRHIEEAIKYFAKQSSKKTS